MKAITAESAMSTPFMILAGVDKVHIRGQSVQNESHGLPFEEG
jgi:hypothetical protein